MDIVKLCGTVAIAVGLAALIRGFKPGFATAVSICGCLVLTAATLTVYAEPFSFITRELSRFIPEGGLGVLMKSAGVAFVTGFAADTCRELGETAVATRVELLGQAEILLLSLPLIAELLEFASNLLR